MKKIIKEYLTFTNSEKRGVMGLLILLAAFTLAPYIIHFFKKEEVIDFSTFKKDMTVLSNGALQHATTKKEEDHFIHHNITLFKFDPNNLSAYNWAKLGCSQKLIKTILKYQERGGHFKSKSDLKKIYGLSAAEYTRLEPFIQIKNQVQSTVKELKKKVWTTPEELHLDLNSADSATLTLLKGIGPAYASRIVKYRNRLGGYINQSQLWEIYGMDSTLFNLIAPCVYVKDSLVKKININTAGIGELRKHPYFSYKLAGLIVNYRTAHGPYKNIQAINAIVLVHSDIYSKLAPYITTED